MQRDRALRARRAGERRHRRDGDGGCARARVPGALCRDFRRDVGILRPAVLRQRRLGEQTLRLRRLGAARGHNGRARSTHQVPDDLEHAGRVLAVLADGARCAPGGRHTGRRGPADHAPARAQSALAAAVHCHRRRRKRAHSPISSADFRQYDKNQPPQAKPAAAGSMSGYAAVTCAFLRGACRSCARRSGTGRSSRG